MQQDVTITIRKWGYAKVGIQPIQLKSDRQIDQVLWRPLNMQPLTEPERPGRESGRQP